MLKVVKDVDQCCSLALLAYSSSNNNYNITAIMPEGKEDFSGFINSNNFLTQDGYLAKGKTEIKGSRTALSTTSASMPSTLLK
jgi:hypothetical protein